MRYFSVVLAISALFVASLSLTATSVLASLDREAADIRVGELGSGSLATMLTGPTLWNRFPEAPANPATLVDYSAIAFAVSLMAAGVFLFRSNRRCSLQTVAIWSLVAAVVPYALGRIILQSQPHSPADAGPWVSLMVLGVFYSACVSLAFSCTDIFQMNRDRLCSHA